MRIFYLFIFAIVHINSIWAGVTEEIFTKIYENKTWGSNVDGEGHSGGGGSTLASTEVYRQFLRGFLDIYQIKSVVDVGCGDWEFSKEMNWDGIDYLGYDVVGYIIEKNNVKYGSKNIHFKQEDIIVADLPPADLLICKDVLQHLSNEDIAVFIRQLSKFKYCLITNDIYPASQTSFNPQIETGQHRPIDLTQPPFSLHGVKLLNYWAGPDLKQILFIYDIRSKSHSTSKAQ